MATEAPPPTSMKRKKAIKTGRAGRAELVEVWTVIRSSPFSGYFYRREVTTQFAHRSQTILKDTQSFLSHYVCTLLVIVKYVALLRPHLVIVEVQKHNMQ